MFVGPRGATPLRANFNKVCRRATARLGLVELHLHVLRHNRSDLCGRHRRDYPRADEAAWAQQSRGALIYQHAREEHDQAIADGLNELIREAKRSMRKARRGSGGDDDPLLVGVPVGS